MIYIILRRHSDKLQYINSSHSNIENLVEYITKNRLLSINKYETLSFGNYYHSSKGYYSSQGGKISNPNDIKLNFEYYFTSSRYKNKFWMFLYKIFSIDIKKKFKGKKVESVLFYDDAYPHDYIIGGFVYHTYDSIIDLISKFKLEERDRKINQLV